MSVKVQRRQDRIALVAGAAGSIGRGITARLVADGWAVGLIDINSEVHEVRQTLESRAQAAAVHARQGDVSSDDFARGCIEEMSDTLGAPSLVVNCVGIGGTGNDLLESSTEEFCTTMKANVLSPYLVTKHAARAMIERGEGGSIISMGSVFADSVVKGSGAYCSSKSALETLDKCWAQELAEYGIRVNTVVAGNIDAGMHLRYIRRRADHCTTTVEEEKARTRSQVPLGRHGSVEDLADAVSWLASNQSAYVTGTSIVVDGGFLLGNG